MQWTLGQYVKIFPNQLSYVELPTPSRSRICSPSCGGGENPVPQVSPVLAEACGPLSGAAGSMLEGDQGFPACPCTGSLQTTCPAAPGLRTRNSQRHLQVLSREASARGRPCSGVTLQGTGLCGSATLCDNIYILVSDLKK